MAAMVTWSGERGAVNVSSLTLGVTALVGILTTFTVTGTVGRVLRNHPDDFRTAVVFVLVGAVLLAISSLPGTSGKLDSVFAVAGVLVTFGGLVIGATAGARSANEVERPALSAALIDDGLHLKGKANAENLASDFRLILLVEGLKTSRDGKTFDNTTLQQSYVGPDGEGRSRCRSTSGFRPGASTPSESGAGHPRLHPTAQSDPTTRPSRAGHTTAERFPGTSSGLELVA